MTSQELIREACRAFNARDIDAVLALMSFDVDWPNGMTGGREHGHQQVREYWTRQWSQIDPRVDPIRIDNNPDGTITVLVHQRVHTNAGALLLDHNIEHVYTLKSGLITRMDIRELGV